MQNCIQIGSGVSLLRMRDFATLGTKCLGYFFCGRRVLEKGYTAKNVRSKTRKLVVHELHQLKVEVTNSNMPPLLDYQISTLAFLIPTRIKPPNLDAARVPSLMELVYHHLQSFKNHIWMNKTLNCYTFTY